MWNIKKQPNYPDLSTSWGTLLVEDIQIAMKRALGDPVPLELYEKRRIKLFLLNIHERAASFKKTVDK